MDIQRLHEAHELLTEFFEVRARLERLDNILGTDRNDASMRNIGGFLVSPMLYYSIYEQIKSEYTGFYNELKSRLEQKQ